MSTLFISDLHLDSEQPAGIQQFLRFIDQDALKADALYILGDLFEVWIGDDNTDLGNALIIKALTKLKLQGVPCFFMHGNRDFLIGNRFATATGCKLLKEYEVLEIEGTRVLLTHGDLLCTDDEPYMALRSTVRNPTWQQDFLSKTLQERKTIADNIRKHSQQAVSQKSPEIMDVNQKTVEDTMLEYDVRVLLHGHTHRPNVHHFDLGGTDATRIVLGDWYEEGSVVRWSTTGYQLETLTGITGQPFSS
jgi:UDP-2,3-diacylglucosamine hydrolase